jgi:hypothetical protein
MNCFFRKSMIAMFLPWAESVAVTPAPRGSGAGR